MANTFKNIKKKLRRKRLLAEKRHLEKAQAGASGNEAARRKIKAALRRKKAVLKPVAVILIAVFVVLAGFLFLEKRTYRNYKVPVSRRILFPPSTPICQVRFCAIALTRYLL